MFCESSTEARTILPGSLVSVRKQELREGVARRRMDRQAPGKCHQLFPGHHGTRRADGNAREGHNRTHRPNMLSNTRRAEREESSRVNAPNECIANVLLLHSRTNIA